MGTKRTKVPKTQETVASNTPEYSISLKLNGVEYKSTGKTMLEAMKALQPPKKIMGGGVLVATDGTKKTVQSMFTRRLKIFFRPIAAEIQARDLLRALK